MAIQILLKLWEVVVTLVRGSILWRKGYCPFSTRFDCSACDFNLECMRSFWCCRNGWGGYVRCYWKCLLHTAGSRNWIWPSSWCTCIEWWDAGLQVAKQSHSRKSSPVIICSGPMLPCCSSLEKPSPCLSKAWEQKSTIQSPSSHPDNGHSLDTSTALFRFAHKWANHKRKLEGTEQTHCLCWDLTYQG